MTQQFLHGITVTEVQSGVQTIKTSSSSVIGVIGTAPAADSEAFPLNTPVLIAGSLTEAAKLGDTGTLPSALNGILSQTGAVVVVVRVAEGEASGEGNEAVTAEQATLANVIGAANSDGTYTGTYSFLASKSKLGVAPRILIAPGFSTVAVITPLLVIANRLRAIIIADAPEGTNEALTQFVTSWSSDRIYAVYPQVTNTSNQNVPASPISRVLLQRVITITGSGCRLQIR